VHELSDPVPECAKVPDDPSGGAVACLREQVVHVIAEGGELLRDPVVDLPGQPSAFLRGGQLADVVEERSGGEWQRCGVDDPADGARHLLWVGVRGVGLERDHA
jgi:hypothetical protein